MKLKGDKSKKVQSADFRRKKELNQQNLMTPFRS